MRPRRPETFHGGVQTNSLKDGVVGVVGVAHSVGASQEHLEGDVGD